MAAGFTSPEHRRVFLLVVAAGWAWRQSGGHVVVSPPDGSRPVVLGIAGYDNDRGHIRSTFRRLGLPGIDGDLPRGPIESESEPPPEEAVLLEPAPHPEPEAHYITTVWPIPAPEPEPEACGTCAHPVRRWHGVSRAGRCSHCAGCIELALRSRGGLHT